MIPRDLAGKRVTIIGAGLTGRATARFLVGQGARAFVSELNVLAQEIKAEFETLSVAYEESGHTDRALQKADLLVLSPGVPLDLPIILKAKRMGIPTLAEIELAYQFCKSEKIIAVTGTNGKTTTTRLIGDLLSAAGHKVIVAGNIGLPFIGRLEKIGEDTLVVLEVSSFQLEGISSFKPHISIFLNFAPDHLDRHENLERYFAAKCRIFENQTVKDFAVVNEMLPLPQDMSPRVFAFNKELERESNSSKCESLKDIGKHNLENLSAALTASRLIDRGINLSLIDVKKALAFPHRMEFVDEIDGVKFYDDSKATNVAATMAAINSFDEPLVLILGGKDKGVDYLPLGKLILERDIKEVLLMGEAREKIARELRRVGYQRFRFVKGLREGVELAHQLKGGVCLLSPACASFDMFANFAERGKLFKQEVSALKERV